MKLAIFSPSQRIEDGAECGNILWCISKQKERWWQSPGPGFTTPAHCSIMVNKLNLQLISILSLAQLNSSFLHFHFVAALICKTMKVVYNFPLRVSVPHYKVLQHPIVGNTLQLMTALHPSTCYHFLFQPQTRRVHRWYQLPLPCSVFSSWLEVLRESCLTESRLSVINWSIIESETINVMSRMWYPDCLAVVLLKYVRVITLMVDNDNFSFLCPDLAALSQQYC